MRKLAIITTHPIQYNAPLFRLLAQRGVIAIKVFYTCGSSVADNKYDPGFGRKVDWDIPLTQGYPYTFSENAARHPSSDHFSGIDNPRLPAELAAWAPDALLVFGWPFKTHLRVLQKKLRIPILFRGDSTRLDETAGFKAFCRLRLLRWVYRKVDLALYTGTNNKEYFRAAGLRDSQLVLAPHAVDNDFFRDPDGIYSEKAKNWRESLGIEADALVFLFVGKLQHKKSPGLLLEAFLAGGLAAKSHLVIAGDGQLLPALREQAAGNDKIHFIGFQNQSAMPVVYRLGAILILPSGGPGETWGLAINEAMACGRAVIASSKCGGAVDLIREGVNGFIFRSGDTYDLVEKMRYFAENPTAGAEMGRESAQLIGEFTLQRVAEAIETAVQSLSGAPKPT